MTEVEDGLVATLQNAGRFGGKRALETVQTLARADALITRLVVRDFERRIEVLEGKVRELETLR